jgi:hypothetical protein
MLCSLNGSSTSGNISASCITKDKLESAAQSIKPFVDKYRASKTPQELIEYSGGTEVYGGLKVYNGKNNYEIARLGTADAPIYFIKKIGQNDWKLTDVTFFQTAPSCEDFEKNEDTRLAFAGETCVDTTKNPQIQRTIK